MKTRLRKLLAIVGVACVVLAAGTLIRAAWLLKHPDIAQTAFIARWVGLLAECDSPDSVESLPEDDRPDLIVVRKFEDGSWAMGRTSDYASLGFSATIVRDDQGSFYTLRGMMSGYEALLGVFRQIDADSASLFIERMQERGFEKHQGT